VIKNPTTEKQVGAPRVAPVKIIIREIYSRFGMWIILLGMVIIMSLITRNFLSIANILNVIRQISFIAIIGFGSALVLISGGIDLSPGAVVALVSVIAGSYAQGAYPVIVPVIIGLLIGLAVGMLNGFLITRLHVPPFIVTLGLMTSANGAAMQYSHGASFSGLAPGFTFLGIGRFIGIPVPIIIMFILAGGVYLLLNHTVFGRQLAAVGSNEQAAKIAGVKTRRVTFSVYAIAGVLSAIAGLLMTARIDLGLPTLGAGYEFNAISAAVIGGVSLKGGEGSIWSVLCGALIIGVIINGMDLVGVNAYWQQLVRGVIIVLAIILDQFKNAPD